MGAMHINGQKVAGVNIEIKPEIYSTEEREIGVWTDGKPLYEKTVYCPNIVKGQDNLVNHGVSNLETVVKIWGRCEYNNSGEILPLPYISSQSGYYIILGNVTNTRFQVSPGANFTSIENCYVTIQYTKTTDQPGSGTWTPDGVYAHHYSTDEKVVGTYEGETLYEKNIDITLADSSDMQTFAPGTLGIGPVKVVVDAYFKNSGGQQLRMSTWYGNNYWSYIVGSNGGIMIKRDASDPNWTTGVHFVATVQYTKSS